MAWKVLALCAALAGCGSLRDGGGLISDKRGPVSGSYVVREPGVAPVIVRVSP